ncbi:ATP-dependent DNA helicase Q4-like [Anneissia japonica]|uniref:ATP-dependent DNA helicase Q4-like n=1 Tax=Anneissia japonica TaxID=1529436 RepID=UPI001425BA5E|nr:ATP-dependent DNA helicase Q4-like [Anneissia japonica]XP_033107739.1 ATP-dependent DNA helicase Q4-like [Anneissia japonica]XP_033107740.1 ATP-dependent DNA helicase Q4-like [Anneissia japonica]XP_033107741.1 ATP-dependent DNA helicase Q4-like [Anneissia japonica]XP_033107742.1 ATP-dependent DNA helicase Q4-like [Anneissia japonica]
MGVEERRAVLKKALKEWETAFAVLHERRPNKEDIEKASDRIKGYYKEYRQLGRSISENVNDDRTPHKEKTNSAVINNRTHGEKNHSTSNDRIGTGNIWGSHLNVKEKKQKKEPDEDKKISPNSREPVYGLKLREFNRVKILPNSARKRTNSSKLKAANISASQEPTEFDDTDSVQINLPSCKFVTKYDKFKNTSVSTVTTNILAMKKPRPSLDNGWLKRCQTNLLTASEKNTNAARGGMDDFDPDDEFRMSEYKKDNSTGQRLSLSKTSSNDNEKIPTLKLSTENKLTTSDPVETNHFHNVERKDMLATKDCETKRQKREREEEPSSESCEYLPAEKSSKKRKVDSVKQTQLENSECRSESRTEHRNISDEIVASHQATQPYSANNQCEREDNETAKDNDEGNETAKPIKMKKKKLSIPARSSASLNENFVKINLKKKVYTRGTNKMTGPAYKRQQWKIKTGQTSGKSYSKSGGGGGGGGWRKPGTCFKCGLEGHWAKFCKGKRAPVKPDIQEDDEVNPEDMTESPFPTLEEAAIAATGIKQPKGEVTFNFLNAPAPPPEDDAPVVRIAIEPLFELDDNGKPIETPKTVYKALKEMGFDSFRGGQEKAIMRILSGLSTLVVLSTGAGKSLCYQLPAYLYSKRSHCITLVISPLVSLMEDQVIGLPGCLQGARLHSNMTKPQREKVVKEITDGNVQVLLVSPEAVVGGGGGGGCLPPLHQLPPIAFACIDEAHCVSEWSHNFRPSYLMVCKVIRERFGVQCLLGLTATATMSTAMSVVSHLGIDEDAVVRGRSVPNNLKLSVSKDVNRDRALVELLQGDRFSNLDSIIVYCIRRDQTEKVASVLRTCLQDAQRKDVPAMDLEETDKKDNAGEINEEVENNEEAEDVKKKKKGEGKGKTKKEKKIKKPKKMTYKSTKLAPNERPEVNSAETYHAGMSACQRRRVQNAFMSGSIRIVVATVAFGMGLDKSDVRAIIHYNMPKSFESYVQEIGRAGRDGKPAHCHLFLDSEGRDLSELRRHTYANTLDRFTLKKLCRKVFALCRCKEKEEARQAAKEALAFEDDDAEYMMIPDEMLMQKESPAEVIPQLDQIDVVENTSTSDALQNVTKEQTTTEGSETAVAPSPRKQPSFRKHRLCPGHERAIPIEQTVESLDIKEEGIATLLCHLELHPQQWVSNLPPALATCNVSCYGGPKQLQTMAHKCPALAAAIALHQQKTGKSLRNHSNIEFPVVDVASEMNWQSGLVKRELKNLQWNGKSKTGIMVELSDLGFHFRSPGDLTDEELDGVVDFLYSKVKAQEKRELFQLKSLFQALNSVSCDHYWMCSADVDEETSEELKTILRDYFDQKSLVQWMDDEEIQIDDSIVASAASVRGSVRAFISLHHDRDFSGRAIARIFHGIGSPCYPAKVWGRDRRFWRCHLDFDFNLLIKIATEVVLKMR